MPKPRSSSPVSHQVRSRRKIDGGAVKQERCGSCGSAPFVTGTTLRHRKAAQMAKWRPSAHGSGAILELGNGIRASVHWEASERLPYGAPRYNVTVLGVRLPGRSETLEEAKARSESGLRVALTRALEALDQ